MPRLGAHMSIAGGFDKAIDRGEASGCETIQIFTKSNRQWAAKPITTEQVDAFLARRETSDIGPIFVHGSYLLNLGSVEESTRERSIAGLVDELERAALLALPFVVLHPGSHGGDGEETGIARIATNLRKVIDQTAALDVRVCLEGMAGQGSTIGNAFEHLAAIYEQTDAEERLCVCLDTCHMFSAGYELCDQDGYEQTIAEFDRVVGLQRLAAFHLNDSACGFGEHKDRHQHIGQGHIGTAGFANVLNDARLQHVPMVLETPKKNDPDDDIENLKVLRELLT